MRTIIMLLALSVLSISTTVYAENLEDLRKYEYANPEIDLKAAISRNDLRFKSLMGYTEYIPGVDDYSAKYSKYGLDLIKGSSDFIQSYEHGRLIVIAQYYARNYNTELLKYINHLESINLAKNLLGYSTLLNVMIIEDGSTGNINSLPESLHTSLVSRKSCCVNLAWWFNPIIKNKPQYNWNQFLDVYNKVNKAVCNHKWIQEWINTGIRRNAEAQIFGLRPYTETDMKSFVMTAWKRAGLGSEPYYEINLREGSEWFATIFISKDQMSALITSKSDHSLQNKNVNNSHWLDEIKPFSYHPNAKKKEYITVDKNGKWRKGS